MNAYRSMPFLLLISCLLLPVSLNAQGASPERLPVRGMAIAAPNPEELPRFLTFIKEELAPRKLNTLILRVDYGYAYESHPELRNDHPLSREEVKQLVSACREAGIRLIPQINLLGHQSWHTQTEKLLEVYPEFDETPWIELPEEYKWPNEDGLYCKSYCPLHPKVHEVVFALVDEICEAFEADAFHAGMDEVFYLGEAKCPRCSGMDKARLFADEVNRIEDHLAVQGRELWIWGDRLIDGETTGIGMWEASTNDTHAAIDLIDKDVFICDWHYVRPEPTAVYFAMKGFRVVSCPWRKPEVGVAQALAMYQWRDQANTELQQRFQGVVHTVWSSTTRFLDEFYQEDPPTPNEQGELLSAAACFRALFEQVNAGAPAN